MHAAVRLTKPEPFVPETADDSSKLPAKYANYRFLFVHYPKGWGFNEADGFMPELSEIVAMPGANGIGDDGKLSKAIGGSVQKGGVIINPQDGRLGEWVNYVASYPCRNGRKHYCFKSVEFDILSDGDVKQRDTSKDYRRFLAHIRDGGFIAPMSEAVYNGLLEVEGRGLERCIKAASNNPHRAPQVEAKQKRIEAMRAAWLAMNGEATPVGSMSGAKDESAALAAELGGAPADGKVRPTKPTKGEA